MRHRVKKKILGRSTNARRALLREMSRSLLEHGKITTTKAKAKEVGRHIDKLVSAAQTDTIAARRKAHSFFGKRDVVNTLFDKVAPQFSDRNSGYTRIVPVGKRRGDNTQLVELQFISPLKHTGLARPETTKPNKKTAKQSTSKKKAPAKKTTTAKKSKTAATPAKSAKKTTAKKPATKSKTTTKKK